MHVEQPNACRPALHAAAKDPKGNAHSDSALTLCSVKNQSSQAPAIAAESQKEPSLYGHLLFLPCEMRHAVFEKLSIHDLAALAQTSTALRADCVAVARSKDDSTLKAQWFESARSGQADILKFLIDADFPLNAADEDGRNAMYYAAKSGNAETTALLWDPAFESFRVTTTDGKPGGSRMLISFANSGNETAVRTLLAVGAHPDTISLSSKRTALQIAVENNSKECVHALLEAGASANGTKVPGQDSPLSAAIRDNRGYLVEILLTQPGINLDIPDSAGFTALEKAVELDCYRGPEYNILEQLRAYEASGRGAEPQQ